MPNNSAEANCDVAFFDQTEAFMRLDERVFASTSFKM